LAGGVSIIGCSSKVFAGGFQPPLEGCAPVLIVGQFRGRSGLDGFNPCQQLPAVCRYGLSIRQTRAEKEIMLQFFEIRIRR